MNHRKLLLPLLSFSLITLTACEPSAQDSGSASKVSVNGVSEDGYVSGGIVWHDINNDNELDNGEPYAITDEEGYFSRSRDKTSDTPAGAASIDYCGASATDAQKRHCLQVNATSGVSSEVIIRLQKGIDIITSEPFVGSISLKATISTAGVISTVVATPITAMLTHMTAAEKTAFAARESVAESVLTSDFLDFVHKGGNASPAQVKFIKAALQVHKSVELANTLLLARYKIVGTAGVPSDASDFVYKAITDAFKATPTGTLSTFMETGLTASTLTTVFTNAENALITAVKAAGKVQGTDTGFPTGTINTTLWNGLAARVLNTTADIKAAMEATVDGSTTIDKDQIFARAKAVEVIKETIKKEIETTISDAFGESGAGTPNSAQLDSITAHTNARVLVSTPSNIDSIKTAGDSFDTASAATELKTKVAAATVTAATRPAGARLFISTTTSLAGNEINLATSASSTTTTPLTGKELTYLNGTTGNEKAFGKSRMFFGTNSGETSASATNGPLVVCNLFNDGKITTSVAETKGLFIGGTWRKINDYTVQLNATIAGQPRTIIVKSLGFETDNTANAVVSATNKRKYSADLNNEVKEFASDSQITATDSTFVLPTNATTCQAAL